MVMMMMSVVVTSATGFPSIRRLRSAFLRRVARVGQRHSVRDASRLHFRESFTVSNHVHTLYRVKAKNTTAEGRAEEEDVVVKKTLFASIATPRRKEERKKRGKVYLEQKRYRPTFASISFRGSFCLRRREKKEENIFPSDFSTNSFHLRRNDEKSFLFSEFWNRIFQRHERKIHTHIVGNLCGQEGRKKDASVLKTFNFVSSRYRERKRRKKIRFCAGKKKYFSFANPCSGRKRLSLCREMKKFFLLLQEEELGGEKVLHLFLVWKDRNL